jgi:hypothetical protein
MSETRLKRGVTVLLLTLLLSGSVAMAACTPTSTKIKRPTRPVLESIETNDRGGICLDREDSTELLNYLDTLENSECFY